MNLANFPLGVLALILGDSSSSHLIIKLWKCGNVALTSKLTKGVTYVDWELSQLASGLCPPRLLHSLHALRHLCIRGTGTLNTAEMVESLLKNLPETLETLELPTPTSLWPSSLDLAQTFPLLQTLCLNTSKSSNGFPPVLLPLPPNLTHLACEGIQLNFTAPFMAILPRTLRSLDARLFIDFGSLDLKPFLEDFEHAPPALEYVKELYWRGDAPKDVPWIPQTLTNIEYHRWSLDDCRFAPPGLCSLQIASAHSRAIDRQSWTSLLPNKLRSLIWMPVNESCFLSSTTIPLLPRTLTSLTIEFADMIEWGSLQDIPNGPDKASKLWPPQLTHMNIIARTSDALTLSLLPRTLLSLTVKTEGAADADFYVGELPEALTTLSLFTLGPHIIRLIGDLPKTLKSLSIASNVEESGGMALSSLKSFPPSITSLSLQLALESDLHHLPQDPVYLLPGITRLSLVRWPTRWFSAIPKTVTQLQITACLCTHGASEEAYWECLPRGLRTLTVYPYLPEASPSPFFSTKCLANLIKIKGLTIPASIAHFPSSAVRSLPREMRSLSISLTNLTMEDAEFIPPSLDWISLGAQVDYSQSGLARFWPINARHAIMSVGHPTTKAIFDARLKALLQS